MAAAANGVAIIVYPEGWPSIEALNEAVSLKRVMNRNVWTGDGDDCDLLMRHLHTHQITEDQLLIHEQFLHPGGLGYPYRT